MVVCNVKGVAHSYNPREVSPNYAVPYSILAILANATAACLAPNSKN